MKGPADRPARTRRIPLLEEVVFLELVQTTDLLSRPLELLLKSEDVSPAQYNVLRILRGSPDGLTCGEIAARMLTRDPDITRLVDRLEKRKLVERGRHDTDRRVVLTRITEAGLELLAGLDEPIRDMHRRQMGPLGAERLRQLRELLHICRGET